MPILSQLTEISVSSGNYYFPVSDSGIATYKIKYSSLGGTGIGSLVQLQNVGGNAGLPAVDGSQLTGLLLRSNNLSDLISALTARSNLGLAIGVDVQAFSSGLTQIAALSPSSGNIIYYNGSGWALTTQSSGGGGGGSGTTYDESIGFGSIGLADNATLTLRGHTTYAGTVKSLKSLKTTSGSVIVTVKINDVAVTGMSGLSATSSSQNVNAAGANTFTSGSYITVDLTSNSGALNLQGSLIIG